MKMKQAFEHIDKILGAERGSHLPRVLIVHAPCLEVLAEIRARYAFPDTRIVRASSLCVHDHILGRHDLIDALKKRREPTVLMEFTSLWKLYGKEKLARELAYLLGAGFEHPLVIVAYRLDDVLRQLKDDDPRRERQMVWIQPEGSGMPQLMLSFAWIAQGVAVDRLIDANHFCATVEGVHKMAACMENEQLQSRKSACVLVHTQAKKEDYSCDYYPIEEIRSPFQFVLMYDGNLRASKPSDGTDDQWSWLLRKLNEFGPFENVVKQELELEKSLLSRLDQYGEWSLEQRWLYWLALRIYGTNNAYLRQVIEQTSDYTMLIRNLYRVIVDIPVRSEEFEQYFRWRYNLLRPLRNMEDEASDFSQWILHKQSKALDYLTDLSRHEKEAILLILDKYLAHDHINWFMKKLEHLSPENTVDLAEYVRPAQMPYPHYIDKDIQKAINQYFDRYRYLKLVNRVDEAFESVVERESLESGRRFYRFPERSVGIDKICKNALQFKTLVYFVDALGIEFVPYIQAKSAKLNLNVEAEIYRANLPTITQYNTEFQKILDDAGISVRSTDRIDKLKHHDIPDAQFKQTASPIHLLDELDELNKLLKEIEKCLRQGYDRVVIVSDHGASRLAVISNGSKRIDVSSGASGGRYCLDCETVSCLPSVTRVERDGKVFVVSTGYDRLGGRRGRVETHGGATLEEVLVPMITFSLPSAVRHYEIILQTPVVKVSMRQPAVIRLFSKTPLPELSIRFTGGRFDRQVVFGESTDNRTYQISCDFIKTAGTYTFDVLYNNTCIYSSSFKAENMGMTEKDDFF